MQSPANTKKTKRPKGLKRSRSLRETRPMSDLPLEIWEPWMEEVWKWSVVYKNTGLPVLLYPARSVLFWTRTANSSFFSVPKLTYCWQRTGQIRQSSWSPVNLLHLSSWSSASNFSPSSRFMHFKWTYLILKTNVFMTSYNVLLPRSQPLWHLSRWHSFWCVQRCPWWTQL